MGSGGLRCRKHDRLKRHASRVGAKFTVKCLHNRVDDAFGLAASCPDLIDEGVAVDHRARENRRFRDGLLQPHDGNVDVAEVRRDQGFFDRIDLMAREWHAVELRGISREETSRHFVRDPAEWVVAMGVPDAEQVVATGGEDALDLAIGFVLVRKEHHAELA